MSHSYYMMGHGLSIQDGLLLSSLPRKEGKQRYFPLTTPTPQWLASNYSKKENLESDFEFHLF